MKKLDLNKIKNKLHIVISSKEALKNIEPIDWNKINKEYSNIVEDKK